MVNNNISHQESPKICHQLHNPDTDKNWGILIERGPLSEHTCYEMVQVVSRVTCYVLVECSLLPSYILPWYK